MAPPWPYRPGNELQITAHSPPRPYGAKYESKDPVRRPVDGLIDDSGHYLVDHMDFAISNSPLDGPAPASTKAQPPRVLTIVKTLSHKPKEKGGGGPVVVTCHLDTDHSTLSVAKIFDGFEYELVDEPGKYGSDCMYRADMHYSREAATYASIPARFQGDIVPRYFGSWTFPLPTGVPHRHRWVRMILIEYVDGECMLDTCCAPWERAETIRTCTDGGRPTP
ncbi:hypothetical protein C7999DRAFT_14393 [Corynascus novoguineensis]|uniref:Uncharacterized protein n=1 Tax=Corynascus novoguineensis TaxID=1126955 RepID=A0AAN7CTG0_9PEZI|nr:hypothetical protein C7999DRAFT_14393 [Corynascus novoguineensis]